MLDLSLTPFFQWASIDLMAYNFYDDEGEDDSSSGEGSSKWKPVSKNKKSGLKGRTFKHPLNDRPYTAY